MSLFWTQRAVAGAFTGEAKAFVTSSPGTANSIDFLACSCTDPEPAAASSVASTARLAQTQWQTAAPFSLDPTPQKPATRGAARVTAVPARCRAPPAGLGCGSSHSPVPARVIVACKLEAGSEEKNQPCSVLGPFLRHANASCPKPSCQRPDSDP